MKLTLKRIDATDKGIFGQLTGPGFSCVTLERHDIAIPTGVYQIKIYNSPSHKCLVPLLQGVESRSFIEIHWGNYEKDSKGCILVGLKRDGDAIDNSREAFDQLMIVLLKQASEIEIEVIG